MIGFIGGTPINLPFPVSFPRRFGTWTHWGMDICFPTFSNNFHSFAMSNNEINNEIC